MWPWQTSCSRPRGLCGGGSTSLARSIRACCSSVFGLPFRRQQRSNSPPWRFVIITEPEKRRAVGEIYRSAGAERVDEPLRTMPEGPARKVSKRHNGSCTYSMMSRRWSLCVRFARFRSAVRGADVHSGFRVASRLEFSARAPVERLGLGLHDAASLAVRGYGGAARDPTRSPRLLSSPWRSLLARSSSPPAVPSQKKSFRGTRGRAHGSLTAFLATLTIDLVFSPVTEGTPERKECNDK